METDSFFFQFFKQLPETLFELIGLPASRANSYRFDSVEVKKSLRIDGLFLPTKAKQPLYFVEVQFQCSEKFYANLFAKVFCYLDDNHPQQEWNTVAIFPSKRQEPTCLGPYEDLLASRRVKRVYLDELALPDEPPLGLGILHLVTAPLAESRQLVGKLMRKADTEIPDRDSSTRVIELIESLLIRRFGELSREDIRTMFQLQDIRKTKVWQEAKAEGREEGIEKGIEKGQLLAKQDLARKLHTSGRSTKEIAQLLEVTQSEVRKWLLDSSLRE